MVLRQVWEQAERVGADLVRRRNAEAMEMLRGHPPKAPANPADLLVISPDGGRLQNRELPARERWCEYKAAVTYRVTREEPAREGLRCDPQPEPHWKYTATCERVAVPEKTYHDPEPEVKTFVATTETIERFPVYVELEATRRGLTEAHTVAVVGDGGSLVSRTAQEVCADRRASGKRVFEILDVIHASSHLVEAAKAAFAPSKERAAWLNARSAELWSGDAEDLVKALESKAAELGPRPERKKAGGGEAEERDPVKVLWNARDYFHDNRERIRYDVFRRHGLPLYSCHVESGIKQANHRVKGSEKAWLLVHADEMLALRAQALSEDGRWDDYFGGLRRGEIEIPTAGRVRAAVTADTPQRDTQEKKAA